MSESIESTSSKHQCELLNVSQDLLLQLAAQVGGGQDDLGEYFSGFKHFEGLQEQVAFYIQNIRKNYKGYGKEADAAVTAFASGALMTFELIRRVASETGQKVPDPPFYPDLPIDDDPSSTMPHEPWIIDYCEREEFLPKNYPAFFDASLVMLGRVTEEEPSELKKLLYMHAAPNALTRKAFHMTNFLSGVAEVLVHFERQAWIENFRTAFTQKEIRLFRALISASPQST